MATESEKLKQKLNAKSKKVGKLRDESFKASCQGCFLVIILFFLWILIL